MAAGTMRPGALDFGHRHRRSHGRGTGIITGAFAIALLGLLAWTLLAPIVSERPSEDKIVQVVLPPPPPPPPPPIEQPKPIEQPPVPKEVPVEQPQDTPPPPTPQQAQPTTGDSALTSRAGAGPSNYGLQQGNGTGTRIGGRPGGNGDALGAYARTAVAEITRAVQSDREITRGGRFLVQLLVGLSPDGRITSVRFIQGTGDDKRDDAIRQKLSGFQISQRPPDGLPSMRMEIGARSGT